MASTLVDRKGHVGSNVLPYRCLSVPCPPSSMETTLSRLNFFPMYVVSKLG